ncbi:MULTISPECIES: hypothetical protein [Pseudoalteromonas]|jgi:hypothetical protein|uniref:hypothetical protein n=1 Tax=Pseudoalteromonas TaxID=53246 RepID=UPI0004041599|nr:MULTISPECIES: hypothetical protein [Pseudoalteromonas]MBB1296887.1 hypothetical protein [Pseudoalteromonas sp. SR41-7]MBB1379027.1 hypothetical protein [Pseudoalteromonas sp. SR43-2]MBE3674931.1 hypothetical protein [Pseudoalteromonas distincta KMM 3548]MBH0088864.1 hypothetical protein [Pseudoalteromonas sp. NSLLW218]|tara:strand:+ start:725 stop:1429 length:705 start_codon:yes stop_codon:yes gene_type:complete
MKRSVVLLIAIPLSAFAVYGLFFNADETGEPIAPVAIDFVPIDLQKTRNTHPPAPIDMSKDPITVKPIVAPDNSLPFEEFDAVNRLSDKAKQVLINAKVLPTDLHNEAYIEFDLNSLQALETGENFDLAIPQTAETFTAEVTNVVESENGDKSIFGKIVGVDGRMHNTVLTVGKDAVYGQFTAPSGNYVFESKGKYGWIAAKRDLYKSHIEHEVTAPKPKSDKSIDIFAPKIDG